MFHTEQNTWKRRVIMPTRIAVFVDGANFFYMQKDQLQWWVDPKKLLTYLKTLGEVTDAYYYVGIDQNQEARQESYLKALTHMGYTLITKNLKIVTQANGTEKKKANLDIEIVLDMFNTVELYDTAVLVSGDGDFERPLQLLRARGKGFYVLSTSGFIARELREIAGMRFIDFTDIRELIEKNQEERRDGKGVDATS